MVRYTLLRILIFFGVLALLWLLGLRSAADRLILVVGAALLSMAISYVVLRPFREDYSRQIAEKVETRRAAREPRVTEEEIEDAEIEDAEVEASANESGRPDESAPADGRDDFR